MTPRLKIIRAPSTAEGTFGQAYFAASEVSGFPLRTLELPWQDNARNVSCIPAGVYDAEIFDSLRFGRKVFMLRDVPGRDLIEIHPGNWAGDLADGWHTDVDGCILPGFGVAALLTPAGFLQLGVTRSRAALDAMLAAMGDATRLTVEIVGPVANSELT